MPKGAEHECGRAVWVEEIDRLTRERDEARALKVPATTEEVLQARMDAAVARTERDEARQVQAAYDAITRALTDAIGENDPSGPYWEDGVEWLVKQRDAAIRERDEARAEAEMHRERVNVTRENYSAEIDRLRALLREVRPLVNAQVADERLRHGVMELRAEQMVWSQCLGRIDAALEGRDE